MALDDDPSLWRSRAGRLPDTGHNGGLTRLPAGECWLVLCPPHLPHLPVVCISHAGNGSCTSVLMQPGRNCGAQCPTIMKQPHCCHYKIFQSKIVRWYFILSYYVVKHTPVSLCFNHIISHPNLLSPGFPQLVTMLYCSHFSVMPFIPNFPKIKPASKRTCFPFEDIWLKFSVPKDKYIWVCLKIVYLIFQWIITMFPIKIAICGYPLFSDKPI